MKFTEGYWLQSESAHSLYAMQVYEIEEIDSIISDMRSNLDNFTVEITDDYASLKAYEELISALKNEEIEFIEINNEGE